MNTYDFNTKLAVYLIAQAWIFCVTQTIRKNENARFSVMPVHREDSLG